MSPGVRSTPGRSMAGPSSMAMAGGGTFQYGKYLTARHRRVFALDVVTMKHPKEIKSFNPNYQDARGYFYGKLNTLFIIRPTIGGKHRITEKLRKSGVEVNWCWGRGAVLGLLETGVPADPQQRAGIPDHHHRAVRSRKALRQQHLQPRILVHRPGRDPDLSGRLRACGPQLRVRR
jgi:hypothetical protein